MASWHAWLLDDGLVRVGEMPMVTSISVTRDATGSLMESAGVTHEGEVVPDGTWVMLEARGEYRRALGVFRLKADSSVLSNGRNVRTMVGESVLVPASEAAMASGSSAKAGTDVGLFVQSMLSECPCRVTVHGSQALGSDVVFDGSETRLDAAWAVLDKVGWRIRLTGDGECHVEPLPADAHVVGPADWHGVAGDVSASSDGVAWSRSLDEEWALLDLVRLDGGRLGVTREGRLTTQSVTAGASFSAEETIANGRA